MLNVLIIGGFLGAGKTTLLMRVAQQLVASGKRVAIIENEAGKVGVDQEIVRAGGLEVREIFGGCVCCSLGANLLVTLHQIHESIDPDYVIVEPSGVASPDTLRQVLDGYDKPIERVTTIVLFDVERWAALSRVATPLVTGSLAAADVVALNKTDLWEGDRVVELVDELHQRRPEVPIVPIAARDGRGVDRLMEHVLDTAPNTTNQHGLATHDHAHEHHHPGEPVAIVRQYRLTEENIGSARDLIADMRSRLGRVATGIDRHDGAVIGHVKASLRFAGGDVVTLRTTSSAREADITGAAPAEAPHAILVVNALAYNMPETELQGQVDAAMDGLARRQNAPGSADR